MEAVFANDTWLGLDMELFNGLLRLMGGIISDFFEVPSISPLDGIIPSVDGNTDQFPFGNSVDLISDARLATLFDEEFPLGAGTPLRQIQTCTSTSPDPRDKMFWSTAGDLHRFISFFYRVV